MTEVILDGSLLLALPIAFLAGLLSFLSPCVLPLAPGYLAYVAGMTGTDLDRSRQRRMPVNAGAVPEAAVVGDPGPSVGGPPPDPDSGSRASGDTGLDPTTPDPTAQGTPTRGRVVWGAFLFVLGFTAVFVSYGLFFGGLGGWLLQHQRTISVALGILVVVLGLGFLGAPRIGDSMWWNRQRRLPLRAPSGLWGAPLLGLVFGIGWTPCIGPTLAAVQTLAFTEASAARGAVLSVAYCLGLGLPFILIAWGLRWSAGAMAWTRRHSRGISIAGGVMLIVVGVLLITGWWNDVVIWLQTLLPGYTAVL